MLEKKRYEDSAGFFLLGGYVKDAVEIILDKLQDVQLAILITKLVNFFNLKLVRNWKRKAYVNTNSGIKFYLKWESNKRHLVTTYRLLPAIAACKFYKLFV